MKITQRPDRPVPVGTTVERKNRVADLPVTPVSTDTTEISREGREKLMTSTGKNAASPAWRAREMESGYEQLGFKNFGGLVSALARGEEVVPPAPAEEPVPPPSAEPPVASDPGTSNTPPPEPPATTTPPGETTEPPVA